jgi:prephenate dehydratase
MNTVCYQGEKGSFSELAVRKYFGPKTKSIGFFQFDDVFRAVRDHKHAFGVIPIENTLMGSIHQNYDLLLKYDLWITGEIKLRISFNFFAQPGARNQDLKEIWSHPIALEQCQRFLSSRPRGRVKPVYDTAGAAKILSETRRNDVGIIAGPQVAKLYSLRTVEKKIEDNPQNYTRFLVLGKEKNVDPGPTAKTSLAFGVKNAPGVLFRCLSVFALRNIDLVKLESRPIIGKPWEYLFYIDFRGGLDEAKSQNAVESLTEAAVYTKVLGCYAEKPEAR